MDMLLSARSWTGCARAALAALLLWAGAGSARAYTLVFDGPSGYGVSAGAAETAFDAGVARVPVESISTAGAYGLTIPDPVVLSSNVSSSPSSQPTTATSRWTITNGTQDLGNAWLVFLTPLSYRPERVGIDLQGGGSWAVVEVEAAGSTYFYPAVHLGPVGAQERIDFLMHHVVRETLERQGNTLVLPRYGVGLLASAVVVPEPALALLALFGAAAALCRRRG